MLERVFPFLSFDELGHSLLDLRSSGLVSSTGDAKKSPRVHIFVDLGQVMEL